MICNRTGIQYGTGMEYGYCMSSPDRGIGIVYGGTKYCWFGNVRVCVILVSRDTNKERLLLFIYIYIYTVIYIYIYYPDYIVAKYIGGVSAVSFGDRPKKRKNEELCVKT